MAVTSLRTILAAFLCLPAMAAPEWVTVDKAGTGFVLAESGAKFTPWGYNYFRDETYRLLEDYWNSDGPQGWAKVERPYASSRPLSIRAAAVPGGSRISGQFSSGSPSSTGGAITPDATSRSNWLRLP
jgi:hypothetical protein